MRALTTIDVARRPLPGTVVPTSIGFSSSGRTVTFLVADGASLDQELVAVDVSTGERRVVPTPGRGVAEADLPLEERLRRERARELAVGVTRYQWAAELDRVLVPMPDGLWVVDGIDDGGADATLVAAADDGPLLDARLSGDGRRVAFVHDDEVHVVDVATGERRQVTSGARGTGRTNGLAEFIAQEEMGRAEGFWWSRDGERIAFCEVVRQVYVHCAERGLLLDRVRRWYDFEVRRLGAQARDAKERERQARDALRSAAEFDFFSAGELNASDDRIQVSSQRLELVQRLVKKTGSRG